MTDRISLLIKAKNLSAAQFADEIGVQRSSISHLMSGRNKPSLDLIQKTLQRFPEVRTEWLLFGKGSMVREMNLFNSQADPSESGSDGKLHITAETAPANPEQESLFYMHENRGADSSAAAHAVAAANDGLGPIMEQKALPFISPEVNAGNREVRKESVEDANRRLPNIDGKKERTINQIIVLYDDRTFITYSPGN